MLAKEIACFLYESNKGCYNTVEFLQSIKDYNYMIYNNKLELIRILLETTEDTEDVDILKKAMFLIDKIIDYPSVKDIKSKFDYNKDVSLDIKTYISNGINKLELDNFKTLDNIYKYYHNNGDLYNFVSGNDVNEYYSDGECAEMALYNNEDLIIKALSYFNYDYDDIKPLTPNNIDCIVRCYVFENILLITLADIYKAEI